jgi:hypothetical protein
MMRDSWRSCWRRAGERDDEGQLEVAVEKGDDGRVYLRCMIVV